jgi:hypothetical protein
MPKIIKMSSSPVELESSSNLTHSHTSSGYALRSSHRFPSKKKTVIGTPVLGHK